MSQIHSTAVISSKAAIGANVEIGPYSVIDDNAEIGDGCFIGPHVHVGSYTSVGKNCELYYGANLDTPQDYTWKRGVISRTIIGEGTTIREYVTIHRPPLPDKSTVIGAQCFLMAFSHIGHDAELEERVTIANHTAVSGFVKIGRGAIVSGYVLLHQFCRLGTLCFISPGSRVRQDVPPYSLYREEGYVSGVNTVGLRRAGLDQTRRVAIARATRLYFRSPLARTKAIEEIESWDMTPEQKEFVEFIEASKRGIVPSPPASERDKPDAEEES